MAVRPYRTSGRSANCRASWVISRTPEEASGWPTAIAPPYGLTRSSSSAMPKWSRNASTWTANASLISNRPMSSMVRPVRASAFSVAGIGPTPMTSGSTPAKPKPTSRMPTVRPSSRATSSAASRQPVAPSFSPAALPAVTCPCGRNGVFSVASPSRVVCGRGGSSAVARPQPCSAERVATGTSSGPIWPLASAFAYFCWLASGERVGALLGQVREAVVQVLGGRAHDQRGGVDELLREEPRVRVDALAHRVVAHVLDAAGDGDVVGAEGDAARGGGHGGHRAGAHPVDREAGHRLRQPGQQRGGAADGQALVAGLRGGGDGDLVDALRRQRRVAPQQLADAA